MIDLYFYGIFPEYRPKGAVYQIWSITKVFIFNTSKFVIFRKTNDMFGDTISEDIYFPEISDE